MTSILFHTTFPSSVIAAGLRPRRHASMAGTGLTVAKVFNPIALALRHVP